MPEKIFAIKGDIIFTETNKQFSTYLQSFLVIKDGIVEGIYKILPEKFNGISVSDKGHALILPGFIDLHTHAAQFNQLGMGMDYKLIDWLSSYTFKEEERFSSEKYAEKIYRAFAEELINCGTTSAVIFSTIHKNSCDILCRILQEKKIPAYVGKVNMDVNCPSFLCENTAESLQETEAFINKWKDNLLIKPIITPRFAPTSSREQLKGLGDLAVKYNLPVQSHLAENKAEIAWVNELFPECGAYYKVYEQYNLYGQTKTLMAHCIHLTDAEIKHLAKIDVMPVHCPDSNMNLTSGIMPARKMLNEGINIGLGSDIGAGHELFMPNVMVRAIQSSKIYNMQHDEYKPLSLAEVFYMATKGGGKFFDNRGSLENGYQADFLVIDLPEYKQNASLEERLAYFVYSGEKKYIKECYANGKKIS